MIGSRIRCGGAVGRRASGAVRVAGRSTPAAPVAKTTSAQPQLQRRAPRTLAYVDAAAGGGGSLDGLVDYECELFTDRDGNMIQPMCTDFGFRSGAGRLYMERYGETPGSVFELAASNFDKELTQMRQFTRFNHVIGPPVKPPTGMVSKAFSAAGDALTSAFGRLDLALENAKVLPKLEAPERRIGTDSGEWAAMLDKLGQLTLDNQAVVDMEKRRVEKEGELNTPFVVKAPFLALCWVLDVLYDGKPIQKFWVLETVARIPYFAYISILHLYESLGFWRAGAELRKVHFAEEWNEMHHLQIMESLGGDQSWFDRFVAEHSAIAYYWLLIVFYLASPKVAYNFMQRVELHAMDTYAEFVEENRELLKTIPPPRVALNYYLNEDLYLFDEFQTNSVEQRRPSCNNLLDVFTNIRDDENEHVKTMDACQKETIVKAMAAKQGK